MVNMYGSRNYLQNTLAMKSLAVRHGCGRLHPLVIISPITLGGNLMGFTVSNISTLLEFFFFLKMKIYHVH